MRLQPEPDYLWPDAFMGWMTAPLRWVARATFYAGWIAGRIAWRMMIPKKAIAVVRPDGLGDAILFEPALRSLAQRFNEHEIHLFATPVVCDLYRNCGYVHESFPTPRGGKEGNLAYFKSLRWRWRMGYAMARHAYDIAIYPVQSADPMGNWIVSNLRAGERWIVDGDTQNQFDWQKQRTTERATRVLEAMDDGHELVRNAQLARQWDVEIGGQPPQFAVDAESAQQADQLVSAWRTSAFGFGAHGVFGVVPAGTLASKNYPTESWVRVLRELWVAHRLMPVFLGGRAEQPLIDAIAERLQSIPHRRLPQPVDIQTLAAVIGRLDGLLSIDTGPAHFAVAQAVPSVILCGGGHPGRFFPWPDAPHATILTNPMPCAGCFGRCKLAEPECLTRIPPEDVVAACVDRFIERQPMRAAG